MTQREEMELCGASRISIGQRLSFGVESIFSLFDVEVLS